MVEQVFFQSSMPRSGSTLLQNIIGQNPDFYVTPTSGVLELVFGARHNFTNSLEFQAQDSEIMQEGFKNFCYQGMMGFYNGVTEKKYVIDKSRGWGVYRPFLNGFYENPKIVCVVRDLRSVISSYEKIYRKSQIFNPDKIRDDSTAKGTTLPKRVDEWVHPSNTIGMALERITEMIFQKYDDKILFIRYEDLCLNPDNVMKRVYQYFDIPNFNHNFDNISQVTKEDDDVYGLSKDLHNIRPILELKAPDFVDVLGSNVSDWIYDNFRWYFDKFNYKK
jgi:sulfotransferase